MSDEKPTGRTSRTARTKAERAAQTTDRAMTEATALPSADGAAAEAATTPRTVSAGEDAPAVAQPAAQVPPGDMPAAEDVPGGDERLQGKERLGDAPADEAPVDTTAHGVRPAEPAAAPRQGLQSSLLVAAAVGGIVGAAAAILLPVLVGPANDTAARLAVVERSLANVVGREDLEALEARMTSASREDDGLTARINGLANEIEGLRSVEGASPAELRAIRDELSRRVDAVEGTVRSLDPGVISDVSRRLEALGARLDAAERQIADGAAEPIGNAAGRLAVAELLLTAIRSGQPFEKEIAVLERLGTPAELLSPLQPQAGAGLPTTESLRPGLREGLARAAETERRSRPEGSLWERLSDSAAGLVRVERVGSGEQPADAVDAALARGDAAAALAAWERLSPAEQQATRDWVAALRARAEAEQAALAVRRSAVDAFGGNG
ncbi:hypothetical protein BOQ54_02085 [Chelatococcus daeguensis]|uniref:Inner membrane protein n=1 Tax=Chelatococcus daeguensis TaxID=444444 RepID=A0AAC9JQ41_9HYPH|nr:hypothetical protein [Chelatococcus daeguensis]APF36264.1 hypothetical protein BOQ54_02085 [Chelatococcus daeguensis]